MGLLQFKANVLTGLIKSKTKSALLELKPGKPGSGQKLTSMGSLLAPNPFARPQAVLSLQVLGADDAGAPPAAFYVAPCPKPLTSRFEQPFPSLWAGVQGPTLCRPVP